MVKPFSPDDVKANKVNVIPDEVIEAVNQLLTENFSDGRATIKQKDIVSRAKGMMRRATNFDNRWLDFEDVYRAQGWDVHYDKPGYCETYDAFFEFTKK